MKSFIALLLISIATAVSAQSSDVTATASDTKSIVLQPHCRWLDSNTVDGRERRLSRLRFYLRQVENAQPPLEKSA